MSEEPVYVYQLQNGKKLTASDFVIYFEQKVFKTIRKFNLFELNDKLVIALSGGKDSITALYLTHKFLSKKNLQHNIKALLIDEGIDGYRPATIKFAEQFTKSLGVELHIESYKNNYGKTLDSSVNLLKEKGKNISPCNICGTFRRNALNVGARKLEATKVVTGHNIDDESQNILLNIFKNNFKILARLGPFNGVVENELFVPRVKPLYLCTEKEVRLYTILKGFDVGYDECPYSRGSFRDELSEIVNKLEDEHKGVKNSIINFFLEIQDSLKEKYIEDGSDSINYCTKCGEPSQRIVCNTCSMKELVNNES
ncbi:MAG: TIGR00269 family protein [Nanoarchaeota archaeon]|nr:TIGR00269 family protein [Nanoarchaeota archaeon]